MTAAPDARTDDGLADVLPCTCNPHRDHLHNPDCPSRFIPYVRAWHEQQTARIDPDRVADLALRLARAERLLAAVTALLVDRAQAAAPDGQTVHDMIDELRAALAGEGQS